MIQIKEVNDYIQFVRDNPLSVSDEVKSLIENVAIPTLNRDDVYFDKETFDKCISFCEKWFYPLFPYQKFRYAYAFMYKKHDHDEVIFNEQFDLMGRGNGKDGYLMPLALFLLTPGYGVPKYNIEIIATSEEQAQDSFNIVYEMLEANKKILWKHFYWTKTVVINRKTRSKLRYYTSSAKTKDGKASGMVIFNELHAYEDYKQMNVFTSGFGKVKHARTWIISTDGTVRDGPLDDKIKLSVQVLKGENKHSKIFPFINRMRSEEEVHIPMKKYLETGNEDDIDFRLWEKANPSLRYLSTLRRAIVDDYIRMTDQPSYKVEFFAKRANLPMRNEDVQVASRDNIMRTTYDDSIEYWRDVKKLRSIPATKGRNAIVGIDLASVNDFVSAGFLFKVDDEFIWKQRTWICKQSKFFNSINFPFDYYGGEEFNDFVVVDEPYIREEMVTDWVSSESMNYYVIKIVADSHRFGMLRKSFETYGFSEETRKEPNGIIRRIRLPGSIYNMVIPQIEREFIKGTLNFCHSALMRWAVNNTGIRREKDNLAFYKIEEKLRKNDPFMAFVHAFSAASLLDEETVTVFM